MILLMMIGCALSFSALGASSAVTTHKGGMGWCDGSERLPVLAKMGVKAVYHWGFVERQIEAAQENGIEYLPMQWGCSAGNHPVDEAAARRFASRYPGLTWLAFNEPDNDVQADCNPEEAAEQYHKLYQVVKGADPTAKIYCCGTTYWPAHRDWTQNWAYAYRARYGDWPPVDGLHV